MNTPKKSKTFRKRHLFARSVEAVVKEATKPLMTKQGKLYGALLRDWTQIVGSARARVTQPERVQFSTGEEASGATLHLRVKPSAAPELAYETEAMLEQCARYFGYRAITRIVLHATHEKFSNPTSYSAPATPKNTKESAAFPKDVPNDMQAVFRRLAAHVASANERKNTPTE